MSSTAEQFNGHFSVAGEDKLPPLVLGELESIARMHSISPQEVFYKWESYCIKMSSEETKLNVDTVRAFKMDIQEVLERENRGKTHMRGSERKNVHATPRAVTNSDDVFAILEGSTPKTPAASSAAKRKAAFETPAIPKSAKSAGKSSPTDGRTPALNGLAAVPFNERQNAGQITETLNDHLEPCEPAIAPPAEARVKLVANTDLKKFFYKPLAMHLSEASEVLDDRIDEFATIIQQHHGLEDSVLGSAASKSTNEVVAVGRIACDTPEGKLNTASVVLETSRRTGGGLRVPLKFENGISCELFPGQIMAFRGTNASGSYFSIKEILDVPLLPPAASDPSLLEALNNRLGIEDPSDVNATHALNIIVSTGPYTADDNLDFEPLEALCSKAAGTNADALILAGPFLDIEHPLIASGDFDLPSSAPISPDKATLADAFRWLISEPLKRLAQQIPSITIVMIPSARDAVNKHASWPQEPLPRKELGLPRQVKSVSNPVTLSLNEVVVGFSSQDILWDLRAQEVVFGRASEPNMLNRLPKHIIQQRHFFPLFPPTERSKLPKTTTGEEPTGTPMDTSYLKLGEWLNVRPDILIVPSALTPFAKVVDSVLVMNPGTLSKRRGAGTYAQVALHPRKLGKEERDEPMVGHKVFERARVDIVRI